MSKEDISIELGNQGCSEMGSWVLEWSEADAEQCWVEIITIWNSEGFKNCLLQSNCPSESVWLLDAEVGLRFGDWTGEDFNPWARSNTRSE